MNLMPELHFPTVIDNTGRSQFVTCPTKWAYANCYKIAPKEPSIHLHAGGAFAFGLEITRKAFWDDGQSPHQAIKLGTEALMEFYGSFECPDHINKSKPRIVEALWEYFLEYPLGADPVKPYKSASGKHGIEFTFSVPLPILHPDTSEPLLYAGRFDLLGVYQDTMFAVDEKTASQLGKSWLDQWELDSQFTGYCWAGQQYNFPVGGAIIRGISILKEKYGHAQAIIYRPQWMLERWYENLLWDIEAMLGTYDRLRNGKHIKMALDKGICAQYGGCSYARLCTSQNPALWIEAEYAPRNWNPLHKGA
jgi:hypothetical protein